MMVDGGDDDIPYAYNELFKAQLERKANIYSTTSVNKITLRQRQSFIRVSYKIV